MKWVRYSCELQTRYKAHGYGHDLHVVNIFVIMACFHVLREVGVSKKSVRPRPPSTFRAHQTPIIASKPAHFPFLSFSTTFLAIPCGACSRRRFVIGVGTNSLGSKQPRMATQTNKYRGARPKISQRHRLHTHNHTYNLRLCFRCWRGVEEF